MVTENQLSHLSFSYLIQHLTLVYVMST